MRGVAAALAVPQVAIGLWAVLAPSGWFDSFPGFDPRLVAATPPFNEHLATDAGAGFLATGVALLVAAVWGWRRPFVLGLVTYLCFTVPHALYHAFNEAPGLSGSEDVVNVFGLALGPVVAAGVLVLAVWRPVRTSVATT